MGATSQENLSSVFLTRSDINRAVQPQKMARGMKFQIWKVEGIVLFVLCENKGADQLCGYCTLICAFVFAYAKNRIFHCVAHRILKMESYIFMQHFL